MRVCPHNTLDSVFALSLARVQDHIYDALASAYGVVALVALVSRPTRRRASQRSAAQVVPTPSEEHTHMHRATARGARVPPPCH